MHRVWRQRRVMASPGMPGRRRAIVAGAVEPTREQGLGDADPLHEERGAAAPRARGRGLDALRTRAASARTRSSGASTALLHDFDYEIHPTLDQHPQDGAPILREEGYPEG